MDTTSNFSCASRKLPFFGRLVPTDYDDGGYKFSDGFRLLLYGACYTCRLRLIRSAMTNV